ncbi:hypothetical protein [Pseudomonas helleri]|uniref:hypothetical protein n=1 Tax=Pseudomonas helleri TaxID=1608996 RepID=UPI0038274D69
MDHQKVKAELTSLGLDWRGERARLSADLYESEDRVRGQNRGINLASGVAVPKPPKSDTLLNPDVDRWQKALAMEDMSSWALCDSDPLKLHYIWSLWQIGEASEHPGRVRFGFPSEMPTLKSLDGRYAVEAFDQMIGSLPRPAHNS